MTITINKFTGESPTYTNAKGVTISGWTAIITTSTNETVTESQVQSVIVEADQQ